ncbi:uncharacterized protein TRIADDRAFT_56542 [Trichoplax adhaerens]|uniref:TM2 domain-containing protein n=1 Tax=Trichoplax adhaerens TaxID=10228 RepID=B3RYF7_TRIAD|nr:hypothetical protein TRIADDRAFT_56542 [Trichoplax adhaerens]EDV24590.1 hypothetical protein TRIADDRAFT_56542 [Trichoplax adhaerens]|eukprot:XP_002112480.1 hypothetical protein TRIADDRAFT_56542 [Trichoplax adhaerens]
MPLLVADARQRVHESEESPVAAMKKRPKRLDDAYVMWVFGFLGVHHFYLGNIGFGFAYLFTIGMGGVGWLVDFFRMPVLVRRANTHPPSPFKHLDSAYVLTFPLGFLGLQHFYLGKPGLGLTYLLTFGLVGIGFLADIIRMPFVVREINESIAADQLITVTVDENTENQSVNSNINSLQATNIPYQSPQPPTDLPNEQAKSLLITETSADTINAAAAPPQHHLPEPYGPPPAYQSIVDDNTPEIPRRK